MATISNKALTAPETAPDLVVLEDSTLARPRRVALVGQPNVGKSVVFGRLTSRYVTISNYPGTTVEVFRGKAWNHGQELEILDTPGINGTEAISEDESVTVRVLEEERPDVVIQVADAKNLRRALLLTAQLSRFGIPIVLVLNMMDECRGRGISLDSTALEEILGIPVVETVATTGQGFDQLQARLEEAAPCEIGATDPRQWVEDTLQQVGWNGAGSHRRAVTRTHLLTSAAVLGSALHLANYLGPWLDIPTLAATLEGLLSGVGSPELLTAALVVLLGYMAPVLVPVLWAIKTDSGFNERFGVWARRPISGAVILAVTISLTFQLVGVLGAQVLVEVFEEKLFAAYVTPFLQSVIPTGFFYDLLVGPFGAISMGAAYGLAIVLPVVSTFFIAFSFLEDSGYLPRLSILADRLLRAMGLHGRAFLPMVLGLGCVTMATMTTRVLHSKKERFIATFLLALGVPCSAQLGVILGITAGLSFMVPLVVFGTVSLQLVLVGYLLSKIYPGERSAFILELPPIRFPVWKNILRKTYLRVAWFLKEALPLFILGGLALFILDKLGILARIISATEPVVNSLLGLPRETATVFLMGFLRRDYGAAGLFDMSRAGLLGVEQVVVGLVVLTLFVPCIANFLVMIKEQGLRNALLMAVFIIAYAVTVGTGLNFLFRTLGVTF